MRDRRYGLVVALGVVCRPWPAVAPPPLRATTRLAAPAVMARRPVRAVLLAEARVSPVRPEVRSAGGVRRYGFDRWRDERRSRRWRGGVERWNRRHHRIDGRRSRLGGQGGLDRWGGGAAGSGGAAGGKGGASGTGGSGLAGAAGGGTGSGCKLPATVSFQKDVLPFLSATCGGGNGCHVIDSASTTANGGYDHAYDWITAGAHPSSCPATPTPKRFEIVMAVIAGADPASCSKSRQMPPQNETGANLRTPLTSCQVATLQAWLDEPLVTQAHRVDDTDPTGTAPFPMPPFN